MHMTDNKLFPDVYEEIAGAPDLEKRSIFYYPYLRKCIENIQAGNSMGDLLYRMNFLRVGLYAVNEFMGIILRDDKIEQLPGVRIYDKYHTRFSNGYLGKEVLSFEHAVQDYEKSIIEKLIICNLSAADEIYGELVCHGIDRKDILTVDELIYGFEKKV